MQPGQRTAGSFSDFLKKSIRQMFGYPDLDAGLNILDHVANLLRILSQPPSQQRAEDWRPYWSKTFFRPVMLDTDNLHKQFGDNIAHVVTDEHLIRQLG